VFVVEARDSASVQAMADSLLASSPGGRDLQVLASQVIGGRPGLLMVNDHPGGGYSDASGFVLAGRVGCWIRELFPIGEWDQRSEGFEPAPHLPVRRAPDHHRAPDRAATAAAPFGNLLAGWVSGAHQHSLITAGSPAPPTRS